MQLLNSGAVVCVRRRACRGLEGRPGEPCVALSTSTARTWGLNTQNHNRRDSGPDAASLLEHPVHDPSSRKGDAARLTRVARDGDEIDRADSRTGDRPFSLNGFSAGERHQGAILSPRRFKSARSRCRASARIWSPAIRSCGPGFPVPPRRWPSSPRAGARGLRDRRNG